MSAALLEVFSNTFRGGNPMTTITARFLDREAVSGALFALEYREIHTDRFDLIETPREDNAPPRASLRSVVGWRLNRIFSGRRGNIALVSSCLTVVAIGAMMVESSGSRLGGLAGGMIGLFFVVGSFVLLVANHDEVGVTKRGSEEATKINREIRLAPAVISLDVRNEEADQARHIVAGAGGTLLTVQFQ
jgi:hypothetical protein